MEKVGSSDWWDDWGGRESNSRDLGRFEMGDLDRRPSAMDREADWLMKKV